MLHSLCILFNILFFVVTASARDVDWAEELAADATMGAAAFAIETHGQGRARYRGGEFPTQGVDDQVRQKVHSETTGREPTPKESRYRMYSNGSVVAAASLPAVLALTAADEPALGRVLTTGHALLLSNLVVTTVKHAVRRPRPKAREDEDSRPTGDMAASFPSGHAAAGCVGATLVTRFFGNASWWVKGGAWALAGATAFMRMEGDSHYLTDVAVGGVIGVGAALAADDWYERGADRKVAVRVGPDSVAVVYRF